MSGIPKRPTTVATSRTASLNSARAQATATQPSTSSSISKPSTTPRPSLSKAPVIASSSQPQPQSSADNKSFSSSARSSVSESTLVPNTKTESKSDPDASISEKTLTSEGKNGKVDHVKVCVRMRPMNSQELQSNQAECWQISGQLVSAVSSEPVSSPMNNRNGNNSQKPISFVFDHIFTPESTNEDVFSLMAAPSVERLMVGYNACVFAYGQTSSGKTHTIHGDQKDSGLIARCVDAVFSHIEQYVDREFILRVSYMEIYNEIINDLLNPQAKNLPIREDKRKGVFCEGLEEAVVVSPDQIFALLEAGEQHRHVGSTNYNEQSSRSHTIFRMIVESTKRSGGKSSTILKSVLNLVDLAGSENAIKAGNAQRMKETGYINKSLLTLGHVIYKLSEQAGHPKDDGTASTAHIPYRDSKLTRLLQSSLNGKSYITIISTFSPSAINKEETIQTLKFATRAKKMKSALLEKNELQSAESSLLREYKAEIDRLRKELNDLLVERKERNEESEAQKTEIRLDTSTSLISTSTFADVNSSLSYLQNSLSSLSPISSESVTKELEREQLAVQQKIDELTRSILHASKARSQSRVQKKRDKMSRYGTWRGTLSIPTLGSPKKKQPNDSSTDCAETFSTTTVVTQDHLDSQIPFARTPSSAKRGSMITSAEVLSDISKPSRPYVVVDDVEFDRSLFSNHSSSQLIDVIADLSEQLKHHRYQIKEHEAREAQWHDWARAIANGRSALEQRIREIMQGRGLKNHQMMSVTEPFTKQEEQKESDILGEVPDIETDVLKDGQKLMDELTEMLSTSDMPLFDFK